MCITPVFCHFFKIFFRPWENPARLLFNHSDFMCVCVYGLAICYWWAKRQGWPGSSLRTPLHPQVGWQATLMTLDGTQTLVASRMTELDSRGASERDLVLLLYNSGKLDLEKVETMEVLLKRRVMTRP